MNSGQPSGADEAALEMHAGPSNGRRADRTALRGFSVLTGGSALAQIITLLGSIAIARLYDPSQVGTFAFVVGIVGTLTPLATLTLYAGIVPAQTEGEAYRLLRLGLASSLIGSGASLGAVGVAFLIGAEDRVVSSGFLLFVPVMLLISSAFSLAQQAAIRERAYSKVATRSVAQSASLVAAQVGLSRMQPAGIGLFLGDIVGRTVGVAALLGPCMSLWRRGGPGAPGGRVTMKRNSGILKHYLPAVLLESSAAQLPLVLITIWFGTVAAGYMGLTYRVLVAPVALIGVAAGQVLLAESSQRSRDARPIDPQTLHRVIRWLSLISGVFAVGVVLLGPWLFSLLFGPEWIPAGVLARVVAVPVSIGLVWNPLSQMFVTYRRWRPFLVISLARGILVLGCGLVAWRQGFGFDGTVLAMASADACIQLTGIAWAVRISHREYRGTSTQGLVL